MIRILQCVNNMHRAGLETMLMNYYRQIDRSCMQFDFLTHRPERSDYDDEIEQLGGRVYYAPRLYPQNYPAYFSFMQSFFREHPEYRIVHAHIDSMSFLPLLAAKRAGVPVRIAHSHNTSIDHDLKYPIKQMFRLLLPTAASDYCACGREAGAYLFRGRAFTQIPNAIDAQRFRFDPLVRAQVRDELGMKDTFLIGHVGRFSEQKNHAMLIDIFAHVLQRDAAARLVLIGSGDGETEIRKKASELGLSEKVLFLGSRSDVSRYYQAMDVLVMPSLYEGVPLVGIEAQFAQLPCVFSDRVPKEVAFSDDVRFLPLEKAPDFWAEQILRTRAVDRSEAKRMDTRYDIRSAHVLLTDYYSGLLSNLEQKESRK